MLTIPTKTLAGLLHATLTTAEPDPELPAPLPALLLAVAPDGGVTMAATDAVVVAVAAARTNQSRQAFSLLVPGGGDDAGPGATGGIWHLDAGDAAVLMRTCLGGVERCASTTVRAGSSVEQATLVFTHDDAGDATVVRLHPATPSYPDWRSLIPGQHSENRSSSLISAAFTVADLTSAVQSAAMADAVTLSAKIDARTLAVDGPATPRSFGSYDPLRLLPIVEAAASMQCTSLTATKSSTSALHLRATSTDGLVTLDWLIARKIATAANASMVVRS